MDKKLLSLSILLLIAFTLFAFYVFFSGNASLLTRAEEETTPSLQRSLLFAWPLQLPADGQTQTEITIFVRNDNGDNLAEHPVRITSSIGEVVEGEMQTDISGKATFHVTSATPGLAEIQGFVDNRRLLRTITVEFE